MTSIATLDPALKPTLRTGDDVPFPARDRALPGWAIDLIREGVPTADLKEGGGGAASKALWRTAMSAQTRGQDAAEWLSLVTNLHNNLARQFALRDGRTERTPVQIHKALMDIWESAWERRTALPPTWSAAEVATQATLRADAVLSLVADPDTALSDVERAVLAYAADQARVRGMLRVALPRRAVVEATGMGERASRTALSRLCEKGLLTLAVKGRGRRREDRRRAHLYALADVETVAAYAVRAESQVEPLLGERALPAASAVTAGAGLRPGVDTAPDKQPDLRDHPEVSIARRDGRMVIELPDLPWGQTLTLLRELLPTSAQA